MRDVRMRGFAERADVEEVDAFLRAHTAPLPAEEVDLRACAGRVLAQDVRAEVDVPGFARASMDGYAVRGEDTFGASAYEPIALAGARRDASRPLLRGPGRARARPCA